MSFIKSWVVSTFSMMPQKMFCFVFSFWSVALFESGSQQPHMAFICFYCAPENWFHSPLSYSFSCCLLKKVGHLCCKNSSVPDLTDVILVVSLKILLPSARPVNRQWNLEQSFSRSHCWYLGETDSFLVGSSTVHGGFKASLSSSQRSEVHSSLQAVTADGLTHY